MPIFSIIHVQSILVITNSKEPSIFVRYNREHLCSKVMGTFVVRNSREFFLTVIVIAEFDCSRLSLILMSIYSAWFEIYFDIESLTCISCPRHLRNNLCLRGRHLVCAVCLQALRDGLRHGEAADVSGLPVLHALRHICPHYHLLSKQNDSRCQVSLNYDEMKLFYERMTLTYRREMMNKGTKKSQWDCTQLFNQAMQLYVQT